jgi:hypothetical protein
MRISKSTLLASVCSAIAIACGSQSESASRDVAAQNSANSAPRAPSESGEPESRSQSNAGTVPESVARLFSRMDAVGPGSQKMYDAELKEFLSSANPAATLISAYRQLPESALGARWKAVQVAGEVRSPEAVAFLGEVALAPAESADSGSGHDTGDLSFRLRYTASMGIVQNLVHAVTSAEGATERVLRQGDRQIAQLLALELFSEGRLSDGWRGILDARGISTKFERVDGAKLDELRNLGPQASHQGADTRTRPRMTRVPAIQENE